MESLVCDLTNALNSNANSILNKKTIYKAKKLINQTKPNMTLNRPTVNQRNRRHNSLNSFKSTSSSSLNPAARSNNQSSKMKKHKKIMNLLLAARASISDKSNTSSNQFDGDIHSLVRIKQPALGKSQKNAHDKSNIKKKAIKSKRLRNGSNKKLFKIQKIYRFHNNYRLHCIRLRRLQKKTKHNQARINSICRGSAFQTQEKMNISHSSSTSSTITTSTTYSSYTSTSDLESSSLGDCYDMENLNLNSETDADSKLKHKLKLKQNKKICPTKRRLLTYRQRRQLITNHQSSVQLKSLFQNLINEKTCKPTTTTATTSIENSSLKRANCLKRKRINCNYAKHGSHKRLNYKTNTHEDFLDSIRTEYEESNEDKSPIESDLDLEEIKFSNASLANLEMSYVNLNSICVKQEEADDEQSSDLNSSDTSFKNNSIQSEFEVVPWWTNSETIEPSDLSSLSNYQRLNLTFDKNDETEFNEILSGALNLMTETSKVNILRSNEKPAVKKRYNNLSTESSYLATKSSSNLNDLITCEPVNGEPIPESNIGNKMLKSMGWKPGTSLGPVKTLNSPNGLKEPIIALKRPKRIGLGFGSSLN